MKSKNFKIEEIIKNFNLLDNNFIDPEGTTLEEIHRTLLSRNNQVILECGVRKGFSTSIFVYNSEKNNSHVYSIDIEDCSDVVESKNWSFFQTDDRNIKEILEKFNDLKSKGVDIIYIDSLHTSRHLEEVLYGWYPYLNKNSIIFIDDIDSYSYQKNQHKDNIMNNINWDEMNKFTLNFSRANKKEITLVQYYKKSGLAKMYKISEKGSLPKKIKNTDRSLMILIPIKLYRAVKNAIKI